MALIIEKGEVNNGHIILSKPLSLPEGTAVIVQIDLVGAEKVVDTDETQNTGTCEHEEFANLPFFGMWADRADMQDSVAWVRKQREEWIERVTRTE